MLGIWGTADTDLFSTHSGPALRGHIATQQSRLLACDPPKKKGQQRATLTGGRTRPALLELTFDQDGHVLE
jgi:hypothetical protein